MMNKEELIKAVDRIFNNCEEIDNHNPVEDRTGYKMLKDIKLLTNGINDLQQRIDKAIEYIENEGEHTDCSGEPIYYLDEEQEQELLAILGGKE